jgi:clusterin-associated protein 1
MQVHLHNLFSQYIEKFQNLKWLETQMETHTRNKQEKLDEIDCRMRRLQRSIQNEVNMKRIESHL